jgi:hypothetical protein
MQDPVWWDVSAVMTFSNGTVEFQLVFDSPVRPVETELCRKCAVEITHLLGNIETPKPEKESFARVRGVFPYH